MPPTVAAVRVTIDALEVRELTVVGHAVVAVVTIVVVVVVVVFGIVVDDED